MLKLMYITNRPDIAQIAETAGADRIFVDMEFIGKDKRQRGRVFHRETEPPEEPPED